MTEFGERFKGKEDVKIVETETCVDDVSGKRKHLLGVRKKGNKWQARIRHPERNVRVCLGCYSTPEEAAIAVKNKKVEFKETLKGEEAAGFADGKRRELYGGKVGGSGECEDDDEVLQQTESEVADKFGYANEQTSDVKVLAGVRRVRSGKRVARIEDTPEEAIGCYSKEKAVLDTKMKRAEFEDKLLGKEDVNIVQSETCDDVSVKRNQFFGVNKKGNKWQAVIRHPITKFKLHLGYFSTPEEAALAVKKKKAEFKEMLKAEEGLKEKRRRHEFEGRKLPSGVRRQRGKFCVRIRHPELKRYVSFGCYSTCDEAAVVADGKRAELRELYGDKKVAGKLKCSHEQTSDVKVRARVRRGRSGKKVSRVKDPGSSARIWSGTSSNTAEEAIRSSDKSVAVQMAYDGLNNFEIGDKLNCGVVDVPDKLECEFVHGSPTSNIEPGMSGDKRVIDKASQRKTSCGLDFDEAVSAGFINEFGQLLGKYRVLDEQLYLGLPDEIVAGSWIGDILL